MDCQWNVMGWWSLFRTVVLLQVLSAGTEQSESVAQNKSEWDSQNRGINTFMDAVGLKMKRSCDLTPPTPGEWKKPICKEKVGCDIPLNCFNYSSLTENMVKRALRVTPRNLELILENPSVTNTCAVVMFYAPWCPYSVNFARQFNALGRTYKELPVLAVDFSENDLYKYLSVYIPLVNFYYRGKVVYRFKATESYEELMEQITLMTKFQPTKVELEDVGNEYPVPTVRTDGDTIYLVAATCWVLFVGTVYLCTTRPVTDCLNRIVSRFHRTKTD